MRALSQQMVDDIVKYRRDPIQYIEDRITVVHTAKGVIPFKLYPFQKKAIYLMLDRHFVITIKSRQVGFSTVMQAFALWCALHYANYKILILSTGMRAAVRFLGDLRGMYDRMPDEYKWKIKSEDLLPGEKRKRTINNKTEIEFENNSIITALPAQSSAARGASINLLIIDEAAFIKGIEETYRGIFPTLSRAFKSQDGKPFGVIVISTPNGIEGDGSWYYKMYMNAVEKKSNFTPMKVHWTEVDEYDEAWYLEQCETAGWDYRIINSELELSFLSSGNTYIPGKILSMIAVNKPIQTTADNALWIFKEPEPGRKYIMGVDFAYGTGRDASAIQILDAITLEQVAEFLSNTIIASKFADVIINLSNKYNNAMVNIERNAGGKILIEMVLSAFPEIEDRLFRDSKAGDVLNAMPKFGQLIKSTEPDIGTAVTGVSRNVILSNMYNIILERYLMLSPDVQIREENEETAKLRFMNALKDGNKKDVISKVHGIINSERLLLQLLGFVTDKNGKPQGESDDAVMSYAHALYLWSKCRQFLLKNAIDMIPEPVVKTPQLNIESVYNNQVLRNVNLGRTQKEITEYIKILDDEGANTKKVIDTENDRCKSVWDAFLG